VKRKARLSNQPRISKIMKQAGEHLRAEQKRLLRELTADSTSPDELMDGWQDRDSAAESELREVEFDHRSAIRERILAVEQAIVRLRAGTYGICVRCGAKIDRKRLSREPDASRCITCQTATEGEAPPTL
jgi:RNA polymerase-binding transcription factor DksA